ncbi:LexA family transcriptional regulator [Lactiplantibacillus plantarum]|uniref:helix-turn-helix domain-containing protein n=1 Tax=Lactiplantibacillus plantarum TaxID=1590 RepID=UPI000FF8F4D1|nr:XRE family transcriptional regulator [Lactiplantibacillus plantarum]MCG0747374.1 Bifunctional S24 family peptidase/transcriptional regulator [Lactiplantibacillus plantarum]QAS24318.1 LexA family transcriptional regulator [Lactiplantibacillus plantarum]QTF52341.1 LexA family transcriptional regulator [Lactiplantibacillus plantarum]WHQ52665.1 XRE family transcriptional regulator [Lactiplantibacillus plantarum]WHQ66339.1 XRE family transcriptional regulator [Lactiplantibacillus plantarum]
MNKEEYLKDLIEIKYGNVKSFSEHAGLKYTTVRSILERGVLNAKVENVIKICDALGIKPEDILKVEDSIINDTNKKMIQLSSDRQQNVYNYADNQLKEQNGKAVNLPLVGKSAANPAELTYGDVEIEHDDFTDVPHGADTAIRIQGDSMEPLIHDGQIIFYHQQEEVENGEIAIVEIDGDGVTCKQIYYDYTSDEVILRSINKKYEPRHVKDDQVRIIGRVIL